MTNQEKFAEVFGFGLNYTDNFCNWLMCSTCPFKIDSDALPKDEYCMDKANAWWESEYSPRTRQDSPENLESKEEP